MKALQTLLDLQRHRPPRLLVFKIGQLGDTICGIPAMQVVRETLPGAEITLLCDSAAGRVVAADLLAGSGLFDARMTYRTGSRMELFQQAWAIRSQKFDALVYLVPSHRTPEAVTRDRMFFRVAGIKHQLGIDHFPALPEKTPGVALQPTAFEADLLLARLAADGFDVPALGSGCLDIGLNDADVRVVTAWRRACGEDGGRPRIALGPAAAMPSKIWPEDRYREVVQRLIDRYDYWPVVFGGPSDVELGRRLLDSWGRGDLAAGTLDPRTAAAAMQECRLYLGNDTGTMHLATVAGLPCVAIFSARGWPGMWHPYGSGHEVISNELPCNGCYLVECVEKEMECLLSIDVDEVEARCRRLIDRLVGG